ncbi:hypothetical protein FC70_GL000589 [Paucilactobacillus oligofermentans DSM 15707 = LMG 22743]|uniref:Uncharacterized protein n=1 Tax=Paucilactobacillus oligofermentans DSM 15707 = LMG 22743 TaxID=1423778 RepID=A0A0R1RLI7_9LACO|nr:multidrug efflux SMR transporter [Paucilactobacillus oligofermentans]KRL56004.1 hypothetical protein FC70_GL000589 [Paucilactobacillus oligofermentans DSM 15707 = LMG 22743]CUS26014.1 Quaternary ammonium compound-resistance protein [Paucilactobacillus oligofermentans DSM 15707 = LMG 22743]
MSWIYLLIAGLFETIWATFLKLSNGFTHLNYTILTIVGMIISFYCLAKATVSLPLSLAYPIWTGIGAVGTVIIGVVLFGDKINPMTWVFVGVLLIGIVGIKITS